MDAVDVVRGFYEAMQARDWTRAGTFLAKNIEVRWPASKERFVGNGFLDMQQAYPDGWTLTVQETMAQKDRVVARVSVDQDGWRFWCTGFYRIRGDKIADADEYWVTEGGDAPPEWRTKFAQEWETT